MLCMKYYFGIDRGSSTDRNKKSCPYSLVLPPSAHIPALYIHAVKLKPYLVAQTCTDYDFRPCAPHFSLCSCDYKYGVAAEVLFVYFEALPQNFYART